MRWRNVHYALLELLMIAVAAPVAVATNAERVFLEASRSVVVVEAGQSQGSGVVVAPQQVITNCHVLGANRQARVRRERLSHAAEVIAADRPRDLCLLDVPTLEASPVRLASTSTIRVGTPVYAIGAPTGLELSLSAGLVAQLRGREGPPVIQTTAPISPGSSGGGLFDERGRLLGITTFFVDRGQNLNFALPVEWVGQIVSSARHWRTCRNAPTSQCLLEEAVASAQRITSPMDRVLTQLGLAEEQERVGDRQGAVRSLQEASDAAAGVDMASRADAFLMIAGAQLKVGALSNARSSLDAAAATTNTITDAFDRVWLLAQIAAVQVQFGDKQGAARTLNDAHAYSRRIADLELRVSGISSIALTVARSDRRQEALSLINEALATARQLCHPASRALRVARIAEVQREIGDLRGAERTLAEAAQAMTAQPLANCGHSLQASETLARKQIVSSQAKLAATMHEGGDRQSAARIIGRAATLAQQLRETLLVDPISPDPLQQASLRFDRLFAISALTDLAEAQATLGALGAARQSLNQAAAATVLISGRGAQVMPRAEISRVQLLIGDLQDAQRNLAEAAALMTDDPVGAWGIVEREAALGKLWIAKREYELGMMALGRALTILVQTRDDSRGNLFRAITSNLSEALPLLREAGREAQAAQFVRELVATADRTEHERVRAVAIAAIGAALVEQRR